MIFYPDSFLGKAPIKRRMLLAFVVLFALSPITPVLARESKNATAPSPTSVVTDTSTRSSESSKPQSSKETPKETKTETDKHSIQSSDKSTPSDDDPKGEKDPHPDEPSKEDPTRMSLTSVNPAALSTNLTPSTIKQLLPEADASTGALVYAYPLTLPPGRGGMAPDIKLQYNNQQTQDASLVGHGWSLSIPSIERLNKTGTNGLYTTPFFSSSLGGELTPISPDHYASKVDDGSFVDYVFTNNVWSVTDKNGTIYTYGETTDARTDNPLDSTQIFSWMLSEIHDLNGNHVTFTYDKDAGQLYPSSILYTGTDTEDGIFEITFLRETRPDTTTSYRSAFPITMNDRISAIEVTAESNLVRRYDLSYGSGDNGVRSLLTSIVETGYDVNSAPTVSPPVTITYEATTPGWTANATWESPIPFAIQNTSCNNLGSRVADINGDGLPDLLQAQMDSINVITQSVSINNGAGWTLDPSWIIPRAFSYGSGCSSDYGSEVVDINGDTLADIIHFRILSNSSYFEHEVYLNTGSGWVQDFTWTIPRALRHDWGDWGTRLADVNGDGLTDFVWSKGNDRGVALNTGSDWMIDPSWTVPIIFTFDSLFVRGTELQDVNGDGLADIIDSDTSGPSSTGVYLNTGFGWTLDPSWIFPVPLRINSFADYGTRLVDFNGDGLLDVLVGRRISSTEEFEAYLNTGSGWVSAPEWIPLPSILAQGGFGSDPGVRLIDVNGDGMTDFVKSLFSGSPTNIINDTWLANGLRSDRITEVETASGGTTTVSYLTPQQMTDGPTLLNPETPFVFDVVSSIERDNGFGMISTYDYVYEGGVYDFNDYLDRKFASFHTRTLTDAEGNQTIDYFHQGNATDSALGEVNDHISKNGLAYRTEILDTTGALLQVVINAWEHFDRGNGSFFVSLAETLRMNYDSNADHRDSAVSYIYDNTNGNVTGMTSWGEVSGANDGSFVDLFTDDRASTFAYAQNISAHLLNLPSQSVTTDHDGGIISETLAFYDNLPFGSATVGHPTMEQLRIAENIYSTTTSAYDSDGFKTSETDPLGRVTLFDPDPYRLYVEQTTNPLGHPTSMSYDLDSGLVTETTDPNGRVMQTIYDGLNRPVEEWRNTLTSLTQTELSATHVYTPQSSGTQTIDTMFFDETSSRETVSYHDGFDRVLQSRVRMNPTDDFTVTDTLYDSRESIASQSLPYVSSGTALTPPNGNPNLFTTFTYDALGRTVNLVTAVGPTTTLYDQWSTTVTDPRGVEKTTERDAEGRLVSITEHEGTSTFLTIYTYDPAGNLTTITDALGNLRHFTYDGLGRHLTAEDLHAPADITFGTWSFTYDEASNLVSRTDPRGDTTVWVYDDLNRPLMENVLSDPNAQVSYTYDLCPNGIGLSCETGTVELSQVNDYDMQGRLSGVLRFMEGGVFSMTYAYNRAGNPTLTTYPDGSQIAYTYDANGYLESIQQKEAIAPTFTSLVSDIDYTPTGKRATTTYANGTTTTNTYDADELYRLRTRETTGPSGALQHLTYTYDANGNVTNIADASNTVTAKTTTYVYDDLNRLLSATVSGSANNDDSTQTYTYDALGNLLTRSDVGTYLYEGNQNASYANPHAVTSIDGDTLTYDENGNVTSVENIATYAWNTKNQLVSLSPLPSSPLPSASFVYDPEGTRIKSVIGTNVTIYPFAGFRYENDVINKEISFDDGEAVASVEGSGEDVVIRFTHTDHLTGAGVVTNLSGTSVQILDYHPFGTERINEQTTTFDAHRKFAGHEFDDDIGLSYMIARYYNPTTGRFLSQDPVFINLPSDKLQILLVDPQQWNSYAYGRNNPLAYRDPDGNWSLQQIDNAIGRIRRGQTFALDLASMGMYSIGTSMIRWNVDQFSKTPSLSNGVAAIGSIPAAVGMITVGAVLTGATLGEAATLRQPNPGKIKLPSNGLPGKASDFVVSPGGTVYPVPNGAVGPVPSINGAGQRTGSAFINGHGGENGQVGTMRLMDPTPARGNAPAMPNGYIKYENTAQPTPQGVNPYSGRTVSPSEAHHPID